MNNNYNGNKNYRSHSNYANGRVDYYDSNHRKTGTSRQDPLNADKRNYYDNRGHKTGYSKVDNFNSHKTNHYDEKGRRTGYSKTDNFNNSKVYHYDEKGRRTGYSKTDSYGNTSHYDEKGRLIGKDKQNGCYIATCVYGSYDTPEVWVLRRFRDYTLRESLIGRLFIKVYYATSPTIVKLFGKHAWFNNIFKTYLDHKVDLLKDKGYESSPYKDLEY